MDVGSDRELGLKWLYDSPYFEGILFHQGEPRAVVTCVLNKSGLIEGLRTDDAATSVSIRYSGAKMSAPGVDIYDDDYWRGFDGIMERRRWGLFPGMDRVDQLSRQLSRQTDDECQQRQAAESPEDRERREERERTLRDLVLRASQSDDVELWRQVDDMVFGPGAE